MSAKLEIRMEFKLFGPGGAPDRDFTKWLKTLFSLEENSWGELEAWFLHTSSFDEDNDSFSQTTAASSLQPNEFFDCVHALRFILEAWKMYRLELVDIQRDLFSLGYDESGIDRLANLLRRIEPIKDRVYASFMRSEHENAILAACGSYTNAHIRLYRPDLIAWRRTRRSVLEEVSALGRTAERLAALVRAEPDPSVRSELLRGGSVFSRIA